MCVSMHVCALCMCVARWLAGAVRPLLLTLLSPAALFLQQCHFLRQAGHTEKAVSLFQAMVDFTFFKPDSVKDLPTRGQVRPGPLPRSPPPLPSWV